MFDLGLNLTIQAVGRQLAAMPHDLYLVRLIPGPHQKSDFCALATGKAATCTSSPTPRKATRDWYVRFKFKTSQGVELKKEIIVTFAAYKAAQVGTAVTVLYDPDLHKVSRMNIAAMRWRRSPSPGRRRNLCTITSSPRGARCDRLPPFALVPSLAPT